MTDRDTALRRAEDFAAYHGLQTPILLAPMAGACPPSLSIAVGQGGGMGACGALVMPPEAIAEWAAEVRQGTDAPFQLNTWIPDPEPARDAAREAAVRTFLSGLGPEVPEDAADPRQPPFAAQCEAMLAAGPAVISSIMGLYPADYVQAMQARGIRWFATATTVAEARAAAEAGADAIVAQGMEAGGHRGSFDAGTAETSLVGLFSLLPAVVDAVDVPVIATGGIADARHAAAALILGASAVQVGTGFLRAPEAGLPSAWSEGIGAAAPEDTIATRAFTGRLGRSLRTAFATAAADSGAPAPAAYPVQRSLSRFLTGDARERNSLDGMQAWAGQSARLAPARPAAEIVRDLWTDARTILT